MPNSAIRKMPLMNASRFRRKRRQLRAVGDTRVLPAVDLLAVAVNHELPRQPEHADRDEAILVGLHVVGRGADGLVLLAVVVPMGGDVEAVNAPGGLGFGDVELHAAVGGGAAVL